jgi:hypothetical protein
MVADVEQTLATGETGVKEKINQNYLNAVKELMSNASISDMNKRRILAISYLRFDAGELSKLGEPLNATDILAGMEAMRPLNSFTTDKYNSNYRYTQEGWQNGAYKDASLTSYLSSLKPQDTCTDFLDRYIPTLERIVTV